MHQMLKSEFCKTQFEVSIENNLAQEIVLVPLRQNQNLMKCVIMINIARTLLLIPLIEW